MIFSHSRLFAGRARAHFQNPQQSADVKGKKSKLGENYHPLDLLGIAVDEGSSSSLTEPEGEIKSLTAAPGRELNNYA